MVDYDFATVNTNEELVFDIDLDETCMLLDGGNSNRGGHPTVTYYDVCFPQLGKATLKSKTLCQGQERTESNVKCVGHSQGSRWQHNKDQGNRLDHSSQLAPTSEGSRHEEGGKTKRVGGKEPLSFEKWTNTNDVKLLEAQSNVVVMAHVALGTWK